MQLRYQSNVARSNLAHSAPCVINKVFSSNNIASFDFKSNGTSSSRRLIVLDARDREHRGSIGSSRITVGPASTDAAGVLRALIQLASSTTILVGSHQSYALLEALESQLQDQLPVIPVDTVASGLWAMTRLQLQPSSETLQAVACYLLQQPQQLKPHILQDATPAAGAGCPSSSSVSTAECSAHNDNSISSCAKSSVRASSSSSQSRLAGCSSRVFGGLCYSLNFYMLRDSEFWAAAAAAGLQHLPTLKPAGISNLLQGAAASGWTVNPDPQLNTPTDTLEAEQPQPAVHGSSGSDWSSVHEQQAAVTALLQGVEQLLLTQPQQLQQWRMRDISQMCQAFALMGYNCTLLFAVVAKHLLGLNYSSSSSSSNAPALLQNGTWSNTSFRQQQRPQLPQQQQWNIQSHVLNASKQQQHSEGSGLQRLAACRPADAVGLAWAYVAAFCTNKLLLQELAAAVTAKARQLHAADCCRLLWAYSTAGVVDQAMLAAVTAATAEEMHGVLPRTAAGSIWSLAQMRYEAPAFMEAALDRLAVCLEATHLDLDQNGQHSRNSRSGSKHASSMATAASNSSSSTSSRQQSLNGNVQGDSDQPSVLQQLLHSPSPALLSGGPAASSTPDGELSMLGMWHTSRRTQQQQQQRRRRQGTQQHLEQQQPAGDGEEDALVQQLHSSMSYEQDTRHTLQDQQQRQQWTHQQQWQWQQALVVDGNVVQCGHRDVAQAVYACGRLQHYNGAFFRVLRGKLLQLLPGFTDSQLVMVLWGLARLNLYDAAQMEAAAAQLLQRMPRLPAPLTALAAWCFAALKHRDPVLFKALADRAVVLAECGQLRPLDATQLIRAAARMGTRHEALLKAAANVLQQHLPRLPDSMIISSLWAFAISGVFDDKLFAAGFAKIGTLPPDKARPLLLLQLFQTALLLQDAFTVAGVQPPAKLPARLMAAASRQWMATNRRSPAKRPSSFQVSVAQVLREGLGLAVQQEVLTDDGLFSIDVAVEWKGRRVAVEVDGPKHFSNSTPYWLLGSSLAKQRCLQARGWAVLSVPFYKWNELANAIPHRQHDGVGQPQQQGQAVWQQHDGSTAAPATGIVQQGKKAANSNHGQTANNPACGEQGAATAVAVAAGRAQYLAAALNQAVDTADVPRGMLRQIEIE